MKQCVECEQFKEDTAFRGRRYCYECEKGRKRKRYTYDEARDMNLRMNYGISLAAYNALFESQGGVCAACGSKEILRVGRNNRSGDVEPMLHVDHCHRTGQIRGLLCRECNQALGFLHDDVTRIRALLAYLERCS